MAIKTVKHFQMHIFDDISTIDFKYSFLRYKIKFRTSKSSSSLPHHYYVL